MKKIVFLFICNVFLVGQETSSSVSWEEVEKFGKNTASKSLSSVESFVSKKAGEIGEQASVIADGMGALEKINIDDFSLSSLSSLDLSSLDISSISNLGSLAGISGMENLDFLNSFSDFNIQEFDFSSIGNLADFKFDINSFDSLSSIESLTNLAGFGGSAKGSLQNLIALESQNVTQDSGQILHHTLHTKLYQEFLFEWKKINFIQSERVTHLVKD